MIKSYAYLTVEQNQRMSLLKARAKARAEYSNQGICTTTMRTTSRTMMTRATMTHRISPYIKI
jgi:hypothetical protein